ncbi:hypothetical protein PV08_06492 [Exophiala spinifera]|uniref:Zn(2)-C6 fungal-type domain-containing protein n=1 Tax=Exophiala spinifera TaxID=91928 RepID=A0A0D2BCU9_9EURO|nr:uncharacterized protein PV08_06492 [Exophiala spinifera]KIW16440.1 hypothetical protein PV08_06492 [Exophiala spinifera]
MNGQEREPAYKRRRVALACKTCRNRKSRCDGSRPACRSCVDLGQNCVYDRQDDSSHGDMNQRVSEIEDVLKELMDWRKAAENSGLRSEPPPPPTSNSYHPGRSGSDAETEADQGLRVPDPVDLSLDGMTVVADSLQESESTFLGPSSNIYFLRQISNALSSPLVSPGVDDRHPQSMLSRPPSPRPRIRVIATAGSRPVDMYALPPRDHGLRLLELFFSDSGMLFPYIHQEELLASYQSAFMQRPLSISSTFTCLLNAIFAMATYHSVRDDLDHRDALVESDVFYSRAKLLASKLDLEHANIQTVQALLLMHQYCLATQRSAQIWTSHAVTIRVAMQLGLHSASRLGTFSPLEAEVRKRIWFGCIILDRTLSTTFGRPPAIPNNFVKLPLPEYQTLDALSKGEAMESTASGPDFGTVCLFTATSDLYMLQGDIIADLYGNNLEDDPILSEVEILRHVVDFEQKFLAWKRKLPSRLQKTPWLEKARCDPANAERTSNFDRLSVILALRYLNARLLLRRPLLILCLRGNHRFMPDGVLSSEKKPYFNRLVMHEIMMCEEDAIEVIEIISSTNPYPSLRTTWWFSAYYCFTAALTVFSCILLRIHCRNLWQEFSIRDTTMDLRRSLQMAVEVFPAYGSNATAQRAEKTLRKLMNLHSEISMKSPGVQALAKALANPVQRKANCIGEKTISNSPDSINPTQQFGAQDSPAATCGSNVSALKPGVRRNKSICQRS